MLGLDTEFMRQDTFHPQLALLQLADGERHALVDPKKIDIGPALRSSLQRHPDRQYVMHSPGEDLEVLAPYLPHGFPRLFDTQLAAAFAGMGLGVSYRALVEAIDGVTLDKGETRSDWLKRPLSASQKIYAALDVVHLKSVHDHLQRQLHGRDRTKWHAEDCERLQHRATHRESNPQPQRSFSGAADWSPERQALLRRILLWRDHTARDLDTPRPWLFQDAHALSLVAQAPRTDSELAQITRGRRAMRGAQRRELLAQLQAPLQPEELQATEAIVGRPHGETRRALAEMKRAVDAIATDLDLPAGLLCSRKLLESFVMRGTWPDALQGWRRPLLHERLTRLLPDTKPT